MAYVEDPAAAAKALALRPADAGANVMLLRPFDPVVVLRQNRVLALVGTMSRGNAPEPGKQRNDARLDAHDGLRKKADEAEHRKILVIHQYTLGMLPDKNDIRDSPSVDVVLDMDGFGPQSLKMATYAAITRQHRLEFSGVKLFYKQDADLLSPAQVMGLDPVPAVVSYQ